MKSVEYNLTVKQFAKLCNTTRDTLRHYYETGILIPYIDEDNGYHYYSSAQLGSFYYINSLRELGYSIKDIRQFMSSFSLSSYSNLFEAKRSEINQLIKKLESDLRTIEQIQWLVKQIDLCEEGLKINQNIQDAGPVTTSPKLSSVKDICFFKTSIQTPNMATNMSKITKDINCHIDKIKCFDDVTLLPMGSTISFSCLESKDFHYNDLFSFSLKSKKKKSYSKSFDMDYLKDQTILHCVHDSRQDIRKSYDAIIKKIKADNLKVCSDLYIFSLFNIYGIKHQHSYLKYLMIAVNK